MDDHDVLWLQTTPSIALLYYYLYLKDTHVFYCLDRGQQLKTLRSVARSLNDKITSSKKKVAVYCLHACLEKKYTGIVNFLLKSQEDLKVKCISLTISLFQWHIMNAWSNTIEDVEWKELCKMPYDTAAFTQLPGGENVNEFIPPFTVADQPFLKKACIVHMTPELYEFSMEKGLQLKDFVSHAIHGWKRATKDQGWSLIWILDENEVFGRKVEYLDDHKEKLYTSIQSSFASDLPIYIFAVDHDSRPSGDLSSQLAWIQHRHHICLEESFLLKWAESSFSPPSYFKSLRCIYLNSEARVDELKWRDNFISLLNRKRNHDDPLRYIRSASLDLPINISKFVTPLLSMDSDTIQQEEETVLRSGTHRVLFNSDTVNNWIESMEQYRLILKWPMEVYEMATPELLDADHDTKVVASLQGHVRATYKILATTTTEEEEEMSIHSKLEEYKITIKGKKRDQDGVFKMMDAQCTCEKKKHCAHIMATLLEYIATPIIFGTLSDTQDTVDLSSQKRDSERDDDEEQSDSNKRQKQSQENDNSAGFIPYGDPFADPTQLVINSGNSTSIGEGFYDGESQVNASAQEPESSQQQQNASLEESSSSEKLLSFPTLSSVGTIIYKESLSNPLAYSPARICLKDVISETAVEDTLADCSKLKGSNANLAWQASSRPQTQNASSVVDDFNYEEKFPLR